VRISERVDNAVRAVTELAAAGTAMTAETIAQHQQISPTYLLDTLRDLKRAGLVRSRRGADGGFTLSRPASQITIADVFRAIDGPLADVHEQRLSELAYPAPADALPVVWMAIRTNLRRVLETVTIADLVDGGIPTHVLELADEYRHTTLQRFGR
jgi:Rrf2 family protein